MTLEDATNTARPETPETVADDRDRFREWTLSHIRRDLGAFEDEEDIMAYLLLSAMGTLGITSGFICRIDRKTQEPRLTSRGLESADMELIRENIPGIIEQFFPDILREEPVVPMEVRRIDTRGFEAERVPFCPLDTRVLIRWTIGEGVIGVSGFGEKLAPERYDDREIAFLLRLTHHLVFSVNNARSRAMLQQVDRDLKETKAALAAAARTAECAEKDLDRRHFHLKSFYDIFLELSGLKETDRIAESFVLTLIGALSIERIYIHLIDPEEKTVEMTTRGMDGDRRTPIAPADREDIISSCRALAGRYNLEPMKARFVPAEKLPQQGIWPDTPALGILFVLDDTHIGTIGIGDKITREPYTEEEQELLLTLVYNFMVFLENTLSFETIRRLNAGLERRNIELNKKIEALEASRTRIEILERAKARIKSAVQREFEKKGRVTALDLGLILGVGLILGLVFNYANPTGIPLFPRYLLQPSPARIDIQWAKLKHDAGTVLFVDARPVDFFKQRHIEGAVNLPLSLFDFVYMMKFSNLDPERELVVYGRNVSRRYDEAVAVKLKARGHTQVIVFAGGLPVWDRNRYPVSP